MTDWSEYYKFLVPGSLFEVIFFVVILTVLLGTIWAVKLRANAKYWDLKWKNKEEDDQDGDYDVEADQGSVIEISQAIATTPEKLAEIMPGLLLVFGLFGTFMGLGVALNHASSILHNAQPDALDGAMKDMMSMMQGLGTKFKTSTWGILGFLLFKLWISVDQFEDKRLRWTILRMKSEAVKKRKISSEKEFKRYDEQTKRYEEQKTQHKELITQLEINNQAIVKSIIGGNEAHLIVLDQSLAQLNSIVAGVEKNAQQLLEQKEQHKESINQLTQNSKDIVRVISDGNNASILVLKKSVEQLKSIVMSVDNNTKQLDEQKLVFEEVKEKIGDMNSSIREMKDAVLEFIAANKDNIESMEETNEVMAEAAINFGKSAENLNGKIEDFQQVVSKVLGEIDKNLGSTIDKMNGEFGKNLEHVSATLGKSASAISEAVKTMSEGIESTLSSFKSSVTDGTKLQQAAYSTFKTTSDTLNVNVERMTGNLEKVMGSIGNGLTAISDGRQMIFSRTAEILSDSAKHSTEQAVQNRNIMMNIEAITKNVTESLTKGNPQSKLEELKRESLGIREEVRISNKHLERLGQTLEKVKFKTREAVNEG